MIDKEINAQGQIVLNNGTFSTVEDDQEVAQHLLIRLKHILGEWFLDPDSGTDYINKILAHPFNPRVAAREIRKQVLGIVGINRITRLIITPNKATRTVRIEFACITDRAHAIFFNEDFSI